jgi:hypothetical protein
MSAKYCGNRCVSFGYVHAYIPILFFMYVRCRLCHECQQKIVEKSTCRFGMCSMLTHKCVIPTHAHTQMCDPCSLPQHLGLLVGVLITKLHMYTYIYLYTYIQAYSCIQGRVLSHFSKTLVPLWAC